MEGTDKNKNSFTKRKGNRKRYGTQDAAPSDAKARAPKSNTKHKYSGNFDLIDSFEAEEKKAESKRSQSSAKKPARKKAPAAPKAEKVGRDFAPAAAKKKKSAARSPFENEKDETIKTRSNREYIPFESYDDSDYEERDYDDYGGYEDLKPNPGGKRRTERSAGSAELGAVAGRNAVRELLRSGRSVDKIYVKSGSREGSIVVIVAEAVNQKIPIVEVTQEKLNQLAGGTHHQGVVALAAQKQYTDIDGILKIARDRGEKALIVIADGIEDPQNLGAVIRCAECAGAHGIIIPKRRAVGLTPIVAKASAGAIEHMAIAKVTNLADAILKLKKEGVWIFAAEAGGTPYYDTDFNVPAAIVFGSEGFGVGHLIKERSDVTVSIPMYGYVNSLNVATAASVILCHAARMQRTQPAK